VVLVDVHELDIVLANPVRFGTLEDEIDHIGGVFRLQGKDVATLGCAKHLGQRDQIDTQSDVAVTAVWGEALGFEQHGHESNVGIVHGLQRNSGIAEVEVAILDEVLDSIDHLAEREREKRVRMTFPRPGPAWPNSKNVRSYLLQEICLL
jgi:hypothetical protein